MRSVLCLGVLGLAAIMPAVALAFPDAAGRGDVRYGAAITVAVAGVRSARGVVRVDICPQAQFLGDGCTWHGMAPAHPGTVTVRIEEVPPGDYAAQAFHDANDNDKVDRGLFGIPKEGVGFSNDAPIGLHPPRWRDARFAHGGAAQTIRFGLRYW